jgi:hypothetical protein
MKFRRHRIGGLAAALMLLPGGNAVALDIGVFGDMSLSHSNVSTSEPSFRLGSLDLYAAQYIDDNTRALFELQFQTFSGGDIEVEIQRFWVMREFSDALNVGAGRFHTPLGYWNRHFHHGILLQDTVTRPFILSFEGSPNAIVPTHLIGILAEGDLRGGLRYEAAIANSNMINSSRANDRIAIPNRTDLSSDKSLFGRIHYGRFGAPFKPGVSVMRNDVLESAAAAANLCGEPPAEGCRLVTRGEPLVRQMLYGVDVRYELGRFDILAEYYRIVNDARPGVGDGRRHDADAWFAQFGFRITDHLKASYRHEGLEFDSTAAPVDPAAPVLGNADPYFMHPRLIGKGRVGTEQRHVFALRYDFSEANALLMELNARDPQFGGSSTVVYLSWAFVMY